MSDKWKTFLHHTDTVTVWNTELNKWVLNMILTEIH